MLTAARAAGIDTVHSAVNRTRPTNPRRVRRRGRIDRSSRRSRDGLGRGRGPRAVGFVSDQKGLRQARRVLGVSGIGSTVMAGPKSAAVGVLNCTLGILQVVLAIVTVKSPVVRTIGPPTRMFILVKGAILIGQVNPLAFVRSNVVPYFAETEASTDARLLGTMARRSVQGEGACQ